MSDSLDTTATYVSRRRRLAAIAALATLIGTGVAACSDNSTESASPNTTEHQATEPETTGTDDTDLRENIYVSASGKGVQHTDGPTTSPYSNNTDYIERYNSYPRQADPDLDQTTGPYVLIKVVDPATIVVRQAQGSDQEENVSPDLAAAEGAPDITVHAIGIEPPARNSADYTEAMKQANTALEDGAIFLERDPARPATNDANNVYAHIHNPIRALTTEDLRNNHGIYAGDLLTTGYAYFYMPPDQKPHRYAEAFYDREGQAASWGEGIWEGVPSEPMK